MKPSLPQVFLLAATHAAYRPKYDAYRCIRLALCDTYSEAPTQESPLFCVVVGMYQEMFEILQPKGAKAWRIGADGGMVPLTTEQQLRACVVKVVV